MSKESNSSGGIGFFGLLQIVFITLKLADVIDWSWCLVMSPMITGITLVAVIVALAVWARS